MALSIYQLDDYQETNSVEGDSASPVWRVTGSTDENAVRAYAKANLPAVYNNLLIRSFDLKNLGAGLWDVAAKFAQLDKSISWDTTGGQQKITQSLFTLVKAAVHPTTGTTATPRDFGGAIGVTRDTVEGCEIYAPAEKFSLTLKHSFSELPPGYLQQLKNLKNTPVNEGPLSIVVQGQELDYDAGEVLFLGTTANQRNNSEIEIVYNFLGGTNTSVAVGGWTANSRASTTGSGTTQSITLDATAGTFTLTVTSAGSGITTPATRMPTTAAAIAAALNTALSSLSAGSCTVTGNNPYTVTFSRDSISLTVNGGSLTSPGKAGQMTVAKGAWNYLWVLYTEMDQADATGPTATVKRPTAAYVEAVYRSGDFSFMILG